MTTKEQKQANNERKQRERETKQKSGLIRIEAWVPEDKKEKAKAYLRSLR